jgi:vacuolar-type H+-ATPase subunit F/Vma7
MKTKDVVKKIFDSATFEISMNGKVSNTNFGLVGTTVIPLKIDSTIGQEKMKFQITEQLNELKATSLLSLCYDITGVIDSKIKKRKNVSNEPFLVAIHKYKNGDADILYSKIKKDFRGAIYVDPNDIWIDREKTKKIEGLIELL